MLLSIRAVALRFPVLQDNTLRCTHLRTGMSHQNEATPTGELWPHGVVVCVRFDPAARRVYNDAGSLKDIRRYEEIPTAKRNGFLPGDFIRCLHRVDDELQRRADKAHNETTSQQSSQLRPALEGGEVPLSSTYQMLSPTICCRTSGRRAYR